MGIKDSPIKNKNVHEIYYSYTISHLYSQKRQLGNVGEEIAYLFLKKQGFSVLERNYLKKWGEIDIIAEKKGVIHFVEVKTVLVREGDYIHGEEQVHEKKLERLARTIETYLLEKKVPGTKKYQLDLVVVEIQGDKKKARVRYIPHIL